MITIYGRDNCSYCVKAKSAAETYGLKYEYINVDHGDAKVKLLERTDALGITVTTVPQIFRHGKYVGGYEEFVVELENTSGGYGDGL